MLDNKKGAEAPFFNSLKLLVHYVHSNFKAKTHFSSSWFSPHSNSPKFSCSLCLMTLRVCEYYASIKTMHYP
jgi:hypothetical protein